MIVDLDDDKALDPARVGAKAAWLAQGRRAGLPILPGFVVDAAESLPAMRAGAEALADRGPGGAQLAVSASLPESSDEISERASLLGPVVVARSSSSLESSGRFSGAFASYLDLAPGEAPRGVSGCWASAFTASAQALLAQSGVEPGAMRMAVLVQPALEPDSGGLASIDGTGVVTVVAVKGPPGPLLQGWKAGTSAHYDGKWNGDELVEMLGLTTLDRLVVAVVDANRTIGANYYEWAAVGGEVWLLQAGLAHRENNRTQLDTDPSYAEDELVHAAWVIADFPGQLGAELILPWALGGLPESDQVSTGPPDLSLIASLCRDLTSEVWGQPHDRARQIAIECLRSMRAGAPRRAVEQLQRLRPPNRKKAIHVLSMVAGLRSAVVEAGAAPDPGGAWFMSVAEVQSALSGSGDVKAPLRVGAGVWEPFLFAVSRAAGTRMRGAPASDGFGAGLTWSPDKGKGAKGLHPRMVLAAPFPVPQIAPLLWDATGLVTSSGGVAAHLFESARALGVPAVSGIELPAGRGLAAVDGHSGLVSWLDRGSGD
ncbi:MAG TPA: PEP/pyruvate-binding domain-containing protein [Acidimicrobiia bacterium]